MKAFTLARAQRGLGSVRRAGLDIDAEVAAQTHRAKVIDEARTLYGSSRRPVTLGLFAMQDRTHPEAHVAWAEVPNRPGTLHVAKEMGAPYTFVHPIDPARPRAITAQTLKRAQQLDQALNGYLLSSAARLERMHNNARTA